MSAQEANQATAAIDVCLKTSYRKCITIEEQDIKIWYLATTVLLLRMPWAWTCFILNLVICGGGTMLMSILGDSNVSKTHFAIGFIQLCAWGTTIILLGIFGVMKIGGLVWIAWLWSAYWGYLIVKMTFTATEE